jgi:hypothetical protein
MPDTTNLDSSSLADGVPRTLSAAATAGLASARENALPGLILWLFASLIVAGFYLVPPITSALGVLGSLKSSGGFLYSAVATALFGGIIPFVWRRLRYRADSFENSPGAGVFMSLFWAWKGIEIDLLYRGQSLLFGTGTSASVIVPKVLVDQFLYNPLWAAGLQIIAYWMVEQRLRPSAFVDPRLWRSMFWRIVTVMISTWAVWIPMVCIIYAMPPNLQVPLFNIALCFWSLMLASLTKEKKAG